MRVLRVSYNAETILCEVEGCSCVKRVASGGLDKLFFKTCESVDEAHKIFNGSILSKARTKVWAGRDQTERDKIQTKKEATFLKIYGISNPKQAHYNFDNYAKVNKEFFIKNFLTEEGYVMGKEFGEFINCNDSLAFDYCNDQNIDYIPRPTFGFNPELPGTLYYIKDTVTGLYKPGITNHTVSKRYGPKFKEIQEIASWYFEDGYEAHELEQFLHSESTEFRTNNENFEGYGPTEFFNKDILNLDA